MPTLADQTRRLTELMHQHRRRMTMASVTLLVLGSMGYGLASAVVSLAPDASTLPARLVVSEIEPSALARADAQRAASEFTLHRSVITQSSDTAATLLQRLEVQDAGAEAFLRSNSLVQQNLLGRPGRYVNAHITDSGALQGLTARWSPNDDGQFKRLTLQRQGQGYSARLETAPLTVAIRLGSGVIESSLFAATDTADIPDSVAVQMGEIFSGDIDFHRDLRQGDHFSVIYESLLADGEPLRAGRVLGAEFTNAGKTYQTIWFQDPGAKGTAAQADGAASNGLTRGGYYTLEGQRLNRLYLAAPLAFSRVSSGFRMRFHPILKTWRAHLGTDYAAPTGTAVRTVGDGVVEFAGVNGGFGKVVFVRHRNQHTTVYAHLSRIDVRKGQRVAQGQRIGGVGATGWATGPHLHFEFRVNGRHVNPRTIARQSETIPVSAAARPRFLQEAAAIRQQLAMAARVQSASAR